MIVYKILISIFVSIFIVACGGDLSRDDAASKLKSSNIFKHNLIEIPVGSVPTFLSGNSYIKSHRITQEWVLTLVSSGLVSTKPDVKTSTGISFELTDLGKSLVMTDENGVDPEGKKGYRSVYLKACERNILKITGMLPIEQGARDVKAEFEYENVSETSANLRVWASKRLYCTSGKLNGSALFRKYDDGWRLLSFDVEGPKWIE